MKQPFQVSMHGVESATVTTSQLESGGKPFACTTVRVECGGPYPHGELKLFHGPGRPPEAFRGNEYAELLRELVRLHGEYLADDDQQYPHYLNGMVNRAMDALGPDLPKTGA